MNNHKDPAGWGYLWKEVQDELNPEETLTKKEQFFYIIPRQGISNFKQLLQKLGLK